MPLIPWGDYRPDVSDYQGRHTRAVQNVLPQGDGYGPIKSLVDFTDALPAVCRGAFVALKSDGTVEIFAGTQTKLYRLDKTDLSWDNVSKGAGVTDYAVPTDDQWSFSQFGNLVVAVNVNTVPQVFDLTSSNFFADLGGSPPQARYVTVVGPHMVLSGLSGEPDRVQWSAENDITGWTATVSRSGQQDFGDGGVVRGVAGGEFSGIVFQDSAIRRMLFQPGSPLIFSFDRISSNRGLIAPYALASDDARVFFLSDQGFEMLTAGASIPTPIGKERVNRTFFGDWDNAEPRVTNAVIDPASSRVYWFYKSNSGATGLFDKAFVYDWDLDRWGRVTGITGEYVTALAQPGTSLEGLDPQFPSLDDMPLSLDDIPLAFASELAIASSASKIGFLRGDTLEATLETPEASGAFRRKLIRGVRPISDAATVFGQASFRQKISDAIAFTEEVPMNGFGLIPFRRETRMCRFRNRIPAGTSWTFSMGLEPDVTAAGER